MEGEFSDVVSNSKILANVLTITKANREDQCIFDCILHKQCKSVNLNKELEICELLDEARMENDAFTHKSLKGWTYYGISKPVSQTNFGVSFAIFFVSNIK